MGKIDITGYCFVLTLCLVLGAGAYGYEQRHPGGRESAHISQCAPTATGGESGPCTTAQSKHEGEGAVDAIRVTIIPPQPSPKEAAAFIVSLITGLVGLAGIFFAAYNLHFLRKQTGEIHDQRVTMQDTLEAMRRQTSIMSKQTEHLKDSVDIAFRGTNTAYLTFEAMKAKERARLSFRYATTSLAIFLWSNIGLPVTELPPLTLYLVGGWPLSLKSMISAGQKRHTDLSCTIFLLFCRQGFSMEKASS